MNLSKAKIPCRCGVSSLNSGHWQSKGRYYRRSDSRHISRWQCGRCRTTVSQASFDPCFRQKKRKANVLVYRLISSGVSQRRTAKLLSIHLKTAVRKFRFLAEQARQNQNAFLATLRNSPIKLTEIQFDDMETFEHTKLKPVSITMAVTSDRKILGAIPSPMPAKGLLAKKALEKYGYRKDRRKVALSALLRKIRPLVDSQAVFKSDRNPHYPRTLMKYFPECRHITTRGLRGCVVGQGELKAATFDPLFTFNHTAAMLRANMNRLFRRTWCTTKSLQGIRDHLAIFIDYFNQQIA